MGTALGALSQGFWTLLCARLVAGFFGGPATAVSLAIIADVIPAERRGQAMGAVMMSVSFAQILGVPLSLELAQVATWRAPFVAVALLGLLAASATLRWLPSMTGHICEGLTLPSRFWKRPMVQISYLMTALAMMGGFILIPNIAAFVQGNLGLPREQLKWMYLVGGLFSLATNRVAGRAVDAFGSFRVGLVGNALLATTIFFFFAHSMGWPVVVGFSGFMVAMGLRNVSYNTLTSKVPKSDERARFQSLQSCIQHAASAFGAFVSSHLLTVKEVPLPSGVVSRQLQGMSKVAGVSIAMACLMPVLMFVVERAVRKAARHEPVPSGL